MSLISGRVSGGGEVNQAIPNHLATVLTAQEKLAASGAKNTNR
jgi:hypothetical protein